MITCLISSITMILLSSGIIDYFMFDDIPKEAQEEIKQYFILEKYLVHLYLISTFAYYIFLCLVLSSNFLHLKNYEVSPVICLLICLTFQFVIFYMSFLAEFIITNLIPNSKKTYRRI